MTKRRLDSYDYIGLALVAFVVALYVAHFVLPAAPPSAPLTGSSGDSEIANLA